MKNSNLTYKQINCFDICFQDILIKNCECYDAVLTFGYPVFYTVPICKSSEQLFCAYVQYVEFYSSDLKQKCKECPEECESTVYDAIVSNSNFPSSKFSNLFLKNDSRIQARFPNGIVTQSDLEKNMAYVNVFLNELTYTKIDQVQLVSGFDLLSNIGGTMGLFMGVSLLSFIEILEFLLEIIIILICRNKTKVGDGNGDVDGDKGVNDEKKQPDNNIKFERNGITNVICN
jgi:hypothetical protein